MARVTVEDCVLQVKNRFDLVMLAAHRARAIGSGAEIKIERDRDKNPVVALREIAEQKVEISSLNDSLINSLQKRLEPDQPEEEVAELIVGEQRDWINADIGAASEDEEDDEGEAETGDSMSSADIGGRFEDEDIKD